ncbi:Putative glycosyltransferase EpsD [Thiorhodovibrio winogradskyi]|uniref:Glycosyltransferase EpsD n=2 Tax=Thiorhodovibrio winogradskyi TaxID=77007 RepID=A0ABZ0S9J8_9GAMM
MAPPMKVLQFICSTGFYGAERWILALAYYLDPSQVQCELAVTAEAQNADLQLVKEYQKTGQATHAIPMSGRFDLRAIRRLADLLTSQRFDLIHTHGYKSDILGILAARRAGIPVIVTPHGFESARDIKLRLFVWLGCKFMRYADCVAPLSPQLMDDARRHGVPEARLTYIQNGVNLKEVEAIAQNPAAVAPKQKKRIGFIGQLISRKNIGEMLDIFATLCQSRDDVELILVGDGEERANLQAQAARLPCTADIYFLGFRDDRLELLKSFDLFTMTSTLEGIPRCLMEAAAMSVPVAAYDIPGIDQLVKHQHTGLLAPFGDQAALLAHWNTLLDHPEQGQAHAKAGLDFVHQHYSAKRMAEEYTQLFYRVREAARA